MVVERMVSDRTILKVGASAAVRKVHISPLVIRHFPQNWRCGEKHLLTLKQIWTLWSEVRCKITYSWCQTLSVYRKIQIFRISACVKILIVQGYEPQNPSSRAHEAPNPSRTPDEIHTFAIITPKKPTPYLYSSRERHTPWAIDLDPAAVPLEVEPTSSQTTCLSPTCV
jgi:hypothetical protein